MLHVNDLPADVVEWVRRHGRSSPGWSESALRAYLQARGAPCFDVVVQWERELQALAPTTQGENTKHLLDVASPATFFERLRFGTDVTTARSLPRPYERIVAPCQQHDGRALLVIGDVTSNGEFFLVGVDDQGKLYRHSPASGWRHLADHPTVFLARIALAATAESSEALHLALPAREGGGQLAGALEVSSVGSACDTQAQWWRGDAMLLFEGGVLNPHERATHIYVRAEGLEAVVEGCGRLGLSGEMIFETARQIREPVDAAGRPESALWMPYRPRRGRGAGWIRTFHVDGRIGAEQVCELDGYRVSELPWPSGQRVDFTRVVDVDGLPDDLNALRRRAREYDRRMTCNREELAALLRRYDLPDAETIYDIEAAIGGLRDGDLSLGVFQTLTNHERGSNSVVEDAALACEELRGEWPRMFWDDLPLVPVGERLWETYYATEGGAIVVQDWNEGMRGGWADVRALLENIGLRG